MARTSPSNSTARSPDPTCLNCDGRGCMGCVLREYDHDCSDNCPFCCPKGDAMTVTAMYADGSRITPGTEKCMCDSPTPRPDGKRRDCEFPCWQRLGMTTAPCCPDCAPLEDFDA